MFFGSNNVEEKVLKEINSISKTFEYNFNSMKRDQTETVLGVCAVMVQEIIDSVVNANTVQQLKLALNAKRQRNKTTSEYNECLENNIVFELYKYDHFISIFNVLKRNRNMVLKMDYQKFYTLMLEDSQKKVITAKQFARSNQYVQNLLTDYSYKDSEQREYDYIFSSLKTQLIGYAMQSVLYGHLEVGRQRIATRDCFDAFSTSDSKAALDFVITNEIAKRLSRYY